MRKFAIALSAFAALGLAAPLTVSAQAEDAVVIKKSEPVHKKVIIKKDEPRAEAVVVKKHRPADKKVIIKHDND
jgi:Ni/Co efflux regulator RcnB